MGILEVFEEGILIGGESGDALDGHLIILVRTLAGLVVALGFQLAKREIAALPDAFVKTLQVRFAKDLKVGIYKRDDMVSAHGKDAADLGALQEGAFTSSDLTQIIRSARHGSMTHGHIAVTKDEPPIPMEVMLVRKVEALQHPIHIGRLAQPVRNVEDCLDGLGCVKREWSPERHRRDRHITGHDLDLTYRDRLSRSFSGSPPLEELRFWSAAHLVA
jgi:hypothetical protein